MPENVWIAGDGRSGTTWLANLLNYRGELRFLFEPFHPLNEPGMATFEPFPYVRPGSSAPQLEHYIRSVFSPDFQSEWSTRFADAGPFDGILLKCIFSNLFLGWADKIFPSVPKILLLRHPCAVAASKLSLAAKGWKWGTESVQFWDRADLREDYLWPHELLIREANDDPFQHYVLTWAILNRVPLQQLGEDRLHVVFYERLCAEPEKELSRLFRYLGHPEPDRVWEHDELRKRYAAPSCTSRPESVGYSVEERLNAWTRQVDRRQACRSMEIIEAFGLDHLYKEDPLSVCR